MAGLSELLPLALAMLLTGAVGGLLAGMLGVGGGTVALVVAVKMLPPLEDVHLSENVPRGVLGPIAPLAIGSLSSMMGIGGGTLNVPVLTLMNQAIHKAVGTAALFGLLIITQCSWLCYRRLG